MHFDDDKRRYHNASAYVYAGAHAFTEDEVWLGVEAAERAGVRLDRIGRALSFNWSAATVALALRNVAVLPALIAEASRSRPPSPRAGQ